MTVVDRTFRRDHFRVRVRTEAGEVLDVDLDRERVSLSLKATQEDPWQHFARTHQIGQIVPGKVTKLVPFGAFVRVLRGMRRTRQ